jgi:pantothenate synthetase
MSLNDLKQELEALRTHLVRQHEALQRIENAELPPDQRERAEQMRAEITGLQQRLDEAQKLIDAVEAEDSGIRPSK